MPEPIVPHNPLEGERPELVLENLVDIGEEQVSIIVTHGGNEERPQALNICLQSITMLTFNGNYELIVVDNGSGQETQDFLDTLEDNDVRVIRNSNNLYHAAALNKGAAMADKKSKYLVFMHYDTVILTPGWLDLLVNAAESKGAGIVGVEQGTYLMGNQKINYIKDWCCLYIRECWDAIGPYPEKLPQIGGAFVMTYRAQRNGFKQQLVMGGTDLVKHYRLFCQDINEYERMSEEAAAAIPPLLREAHK